MNRSNSRGRTMLMYLRGEKDIDDLARKVGRPSRGLELGSRDVEFPAWVSRNKDLVKVNYTELSKRIQVPSSTLFSRWQRLKSKGVRLRITVCAGEECSGVAWGRLTLGVFRFNAF